MSIKTIKKCILKSSKNAQQNSQKMHNTIEKNNKVCYYINRGELDGANKKRI